MALHNLGYFIKLLLHQFEQFDRYGDLYDMQSLKLSLLDRYDQSTQISGCCIHKLRRVELLSVLSKKYSLIVSLLGDLPIDLSTDLANLRSRLGIHDSDPDDSDRMTESSSSSEDFECGEQPIGNSRENNSCGAHDYNYRTTGSLNEHSQNCESFGPQPLVVLNLQHVQSRLAGTRNVMAVAHINPQDEEMDKQMDEELDEKEDEETDQEMDEKVDEETEEKTDEITHIQRLQECHDELTKVNGEVIKVREAQIMSKERFETDTKGIEPNGTVLDSKLVDAGADEAEALKQLARLYLQTVSILFHSGRLVLCSEHAA